MSKRKRTFNKEEKLSILKEASEQRVKLTLDKHVLFPSTFYSWKQKFEQMGEEGFRHGSTPAHLKGIRENSLLKKLLAEKEQESHLKDELQIPLGQKKEIVCRNEMKADHPYKTH